MGSSKIINENINSVNDYILNNINNNDINNKNNNNIINKEKMIHHLFKDDSDHEDDNENNNERFGFIPCCVFDQIHPVST